MALTIEVTIPNSTLQQMVQCMKEYSGVTVTVAELQKHPKIVKWFKEDLLTQYFDRFEEGLEDCCLAEDLGYELLDE